MRPSASSICASSAFSAQSLARIFCRSLKPSSQAPFDRPLPVEPASTSHKFFLSDVPFSGLARRNAETRIAFFRHANRRYCPSSRRYIGVQPMMRALNRLTYDASTELVGIILGASAGLLSVLYERLFRESCLLHIPRTLLLKTNRMI